MVSVGAGVTAAAALAGAGTSIYAATQSGKGAGSSGMPKFKKLQQVPFNPRQGAIDLNEMFPELADFAAKSTAFRTEEREKIMPGSKEQFRLASNVLQEWLQGKVPQDVVDFTNREVAERTGGGFNPFTGGGQSQQAFARSIGRLSSDFTQQGVSAAPAWLSLANSFVVGPEQIAPLALEAANVRYRYDALNTEIQQFNRTGMYNSAMNRALADKQASNMETASWSQAAGTTFDALQGVSEAYKGYRSGQEDRKTASKKQSIPADAKGQQLNKSGYNLGR